MAIVANSAEEKAFLGLLFAGFLVNNSGIQAACTDALHHWGEQIGGEAIIPTLQHFADKAKSRSIRIRALLLADRIKSECPAERDISVQDVVLMGLAANSPLLHDRAYRAAAYLPDFCDTLISAAVDNRRNAARCVRFLRAAGETGGRPSSTEWMDLMILMRTTKHPAVRAALVQLLQKLRPC